MYKKLSIIIGIIAIAVGVLGWQLNSFSQQESPYAQECNNACCIAYREAMGTVEKAWSSNMSDMMNQEKPASETVEEGFENLRTYQCWLEYICRAAQYSGYGTPESAQTGLTSKHLGIIPGCQAPEDMGIVNGWDNFLNFLKSDWAVFENVFKGGGVAEAKVKMPDTLFNALPFIPQCMTDPTNRNSEQKMQLAKDNYTQCIAFVDKQFGCEQSGKNIQECTSESIAFVKLENELRRNNARQKASIIENKILSILNKMQDMESHVSIMKEKLNSINSKSVCYPPSCS